MIAYTVPVQTLQWATNDYFEAGVMWEDPASPTGLTWVPLVHDHANPIWPDPDHLAISEDGLAWMLVPITKEEWIAATNHRPTNGRGLITRKFN